MSILTTNDVFRSLLVRQSLSTRDPWRHESHPGAGDASAHRCGIVPILGIARGKEMQEIPNQVQLTAVFMARSLAP